jgi:tripartite-type tricarboxylate transporter receptor subunit TctC
MAAYGKAHPGKLRYSSGFRNNLPHLGIAKVLKSFGVVAQNIPYKSVGDAQKDLKSGVLDFAYVGIANYLQDKKAYNMVLVLSELPEAKIAWDGAPTIADLNVDLGLSGLAPMGWDWWLVRKETPAAEVAILRKAMNATMERPDVKKAIGNLGFVPLPWAADQYEEIVGPVSIQLKAMRDALKWEEEELKKLKK